MIIPATLALLAAPAQTDIYLRHEDAANRVGGVNDVTFLDQSCGWVLDSQGRRYAVLHTPTGSTELGSFLPEGDSEALAVSAADTVVGWSEGVIFGGVRRLPFIWNSVDGMRQIPLVGANEGWANDIAFYGHGIVGALRTFNHGLRAFEYIPGVSTEAETLATLGGWESEAFSANDGFVGGLMRDPNGREFAVIWDRLRDPWFLATPGSGNARVTGVGINGEACGWYEDSFGNRQSFFANAHQPADPVETLPTLGGDWGYATDLSAGQWVVGSAANAAGEARAYRYSVFEKTIEDLNDRVNLEAGQVLHEAVGVEFTGLIAINGTRNGNEDGYLAKHMTIFVTDTRPGLPGIVAINNAPSGLPILILVGNQPGVTPIPGCPGLEADIANAQVARHGRSSEFGDFSFNYFAPPSAAGQTFLVQAVLPTVCMTSTVDEVFVIP